MRIFCLLCTCSFIHLLPIHPFTCVSAYICFCLFVYLFSYLLVYLFHLPVGLCPYTCIHVYLFRYVLITCVLVYCLLVYMFRLCMNYLFPCVPLNLCTCLDMYQLPVSLCTCIFVTLFTFII